MAIRPTGPGGPSQTGPGPLQDARKAAPVKPDETERSAGQNPAPAVDNAEISSAALRLQEQLGVDKQALADIPPERLQQVLHRLQQGHYDSADVHGAVARRIASELGLPDKG